MFFLSREYIITQTVKEVKVTTRIVYDIASYFKNLSQIEKIVRPAAFSALFFLAKQGAILYNYC